MPISITTQYAESPTNIPVFNLFFFISEGRFFSKVSAVQFGMSTEYSCTDHMLKEAFQYADGLLIDHISTLGDPECWSGSTATVCFVNKNCALIARSCSTRLNFF